MNEKCEYFEQNILQPEWMKNVNILNRIFCNQKNQDHKISVTFEDYEYFERKQKNQCYFWNLAKSETSCDDSPIHKQDKEGDF